MQNDHAGTDRIFTATKLGSAAWVLLLILNSTHFLELGVIPLAVLLAPLVIVPFGLMLYRQILHARASRIPATIQAAAMLSGAVLAAASFAIPNGIASAAMAAVWLAISGVISLLELSNLKCSELPFVQKICFGAAFLYLPIGAVWLVASRFGISPMGFEEPLVLSTAAHFHFSGFAAPLLVGFGFYALETSRPELRRFYAPLAMGAAAGPAMIATGFMVSPGLKAGAAAIFSICLTGCSVLALLAVFDLWSGAARLFLSISTVSIFAGMVFACVYAFGDFAGKDWIGIPRMAELHGITNSFGYVLCGLLGWLVALESPEQATLPSGVCELRASGACRS
ncbi:MAG: YndJ family transporter [Deltaproteobacteria bacterium]